MPDDRDRSDAKIVRWEPVSGPPRRIRFEPYSQGWWLRVTQVWVGHRWRKTGQELVEDVTVEPPHTTP